MSQTKKIDLLADNLAKSVGIQSLANRPNAIGANQYGDAGLSASELKKRFDEFPERLRVKINEIIKMLGGDEATSYIAINYAGIPVKEGATLPDNLHDLLMLIANGDFANNFIRVNQTGTANSWWLEDIINELHKNVADLIESTGNNRNDIDKIINDTSVTLEATANGHRVNIKLAGETVSFEITNGKNGTEINFVRLHGGMDEDVTFYEFPYLPVGTVFYDGDTGGFYRVEALDEDYYGQIKATYLGGNLNDLHDKIDNEAKRSNNIFANALKGNASGESVLLPDVSPIEHEMGVKVSSKNLAVNITAGDNPKFENGVATQTQADTYTVIYLKAQIYQDNTYISGGVVTPLTSTGKVSHTFTRPVSGNRLVFGINGQTVDTVVSIDIADLPVGVYTISADFTNITQGSISWRDIQIEKGSVATEYTPPVKDLSVVKLLKYGGNMAKVYGFSANTIDNPSSPRVLTNENGTTISTTEAVNSVEVIQSSVDHNVGVTDFRNGYFFIGVEQDVKDGDIVTISFDMEIKENPLNTNHIGVYINGAQSAILYFVNGRNSIVMPWGNYEERKCLYLRIAGISGVFSNFQIQVGAVTDTEYEPYKAPAEYTLNADGTVDGVTSIAPSTTLTTDTEGTLIDCEYNKDANKVVKSLEERLAALEAAIISQ